MHTKGMAYGRRRRDALQLTASVSRWVLKTASSIFATARAGEGLLAYKGRTCMLVSEGACTPQMVHKKREWPAAPPFRSASPAWPPPLFCCERSGVAEIWRRARSTAKKNNEDKKKI